MKIAITTPTGNIGHELARQLLDEGKHDLTLLCRNPDRVAEFTKRGAKAIKCDLENREQVVRATEGAEAAFFLCPTKVDAENVRAYQNKVGDNFAEAVRRNKLQRVVFLSSFGAQNADGAGPISGLHDIEEKLNTAAKAVKGNVTHLRPGSFMENWFNAIETIKQGAVYMPIRAEAKVPMIATADIAKVAAEVITDTTWTGSNVRELLGPRDYSQAESVKIISEAIGKPVQFQQVPPEQARDSMIGMGMSKDAAERFVEMYTGIDSGAVKPLSARNPGNTTPTTLEQFAKTRIAPAIRG